MMTILRRLLHDRAGTAAGFVAVAAVALTGAVGLATDAGRGYLVKARLSQALDAAALAGGRVMSSPDRDADIAMYFKANFPPSYLGATVTGPTIQVGTDGKTLMLAASATVPTTLTRVVGIKKMTIASAAEVTIESKNLEVSLVLDVTGSMAGQRIADLKDAAKQLVDIVVQDVQTPYYSKIAVVPYSMGVNVGAAAQQVRGSYTSGTCTSPGCEYYQFRNPSNNWRTYRISTCVTERTGANAYTDVAPSVAPLGRNYPNTPNATPTSSSPNPCQARTIVPLTSDKTSLHTAIDALVAGGSTGGHIGVAWGWYMVSPSFGYLWPAANRGAAYGAANLMKVVVIMTDGEYNSVYCNGVISRDSTSGSGATSDHINCNAPNGSSYHQAQQLCANMRTAGVIVYTVGFDVINTPAAQDLVQHCATDLSHVYLPTDGTELKQAFRDIASRVSRLRLSK